MVVTSVSRQKDVKRPSLKDLLMDKREMETVDQEDHRSVAILLHEFLGYTSMHGAGRVVASRHWIRKTFWIISILACLAFVSWQVHDLHVIYRKRPLATHLQIVHNTVMNNSSCFACLLHFV